MATFDYISRVNECYSEILAVKWITRVNSITESEGYIRSVDISNALKMNLNMPFVIELFGSVKTKEVFQNNETIIELNQSKSWFESRLNRVK
jgi:ribosomal protein S8